LNKLITAGSVLLLMSSSSIRPSGQNPSKIAVMLHIGRHIEQKMMQSLPLRFTECNRSGGTQPIAIGSKEYTDLEVYLTGLSNGQPVRQSSVRN